MTVEPAESRTVQAADMLIAADYLSTPEEVLDFFAKPWKWDTEIALWVAAGSPAAQDPGWALFAARLAARDSGAHQR